MVSLFIMKQEVAQILSKIFIVYYKIRYGNRVSFGKNILVNHKFKLQGQGKLIIDNGCNLWAHEEPNKFFFYSHNAEITIGEGSQLNGVTIHCLEKVSLGNSCLVGSAVIMDTDFHEFHDPTHILYNNPKSKPPLVFYQTVSQSQTETQIQVSQELVDFINKEYLYVLSFSLTKI